MQSSESAVTVASNLVLVVEGRPLFRTALAALLERQGHEVMVFDNAADALFEMHRAGVVVFDVDLPGLDGTRLLGALSREGRLKQRPVIALTDTADATVTARLRVLGVHQVMSKEKSDVAAVGRAVHATLVPNNIAPRRPRRPLAA